MISIYNINKKIQGNSKGESIVELRGLSTDTKPTTIGEDKVGNGSVFIEIDTQKMYFFDAENQEWIGE